MDQDSRRLQRLRQRRARQQGQSGRATYLGYSATAGGEQVQAANGSIQLAESLSLGAIALNQSVQFVGGSFE